MIIFLRGMVWAVLNDSDDKKALPNYLKDLYSREPQQVDSLLSTLIDPHDTQNKLDVEKCLWVICGGQHPEDFTRIIKANDRSVICGLVWDGQMPFRFTVDRITGLPNCEINLDYDIDIVTCECE